MKKHCSTALAVLFFSIIALAIGCSKTGAPVSNHPKESLGAVSASGAPMVGTYADGIYFASADDFDDSLWKETVTITVSGGAVTAVDWNGVNINGGVDKKTWDKGGRYNMVKFAQARAEWYQQANDVEAFLVEHQRTGSVDEISSVSIHVDAFNSLVMKALASGPVGRGPYADGAYFAISDSYEGGWKEYVSLTVINGRIAGANWSALNTNNDDKKAWDKEGKYNMVKFAGARAEWYQQANDIESFLVKTQTSGTVDEIGSVSIHVDSFDALVQKALAAGPVPLGPYADGAYAAMADGFDTGGWKTTVSLFVHNGNIVNVSYSGVDKDGRDKQTVAREGGYGMIKGSAIQKEWDQQAQAVEAYLLKTQDPRKVSLKSDGHTDDIAGATMTVADFFTLAQRALANGPRK